MWGVQLTGDTSVLAALTQSLTNGEVRVSHNGQEYVLTSNQFVSLEDPHEVRQKARDIVTRLDGATRLLLDTSQSIQVGNVYRRREDGKSEIIWFGETVNVRVGMSMPTVKLTYPDGMVKEIHATDPVKQWLGMSFKDEEVAKVLQIRSRGILDWVNLYRIFEIIDSDVGGLDTIASKGWSTRRSMKLFKHTANSPGAIGLDARHGHEKKSTPPTNPMSISDARELIKRIVYAWLQSKTED